MILYPHIADYVIVQDAIHGDDSNLLSSLGICSGDLLWVLAPPLAAVTAPSPPAAAAAVVASPSDPIAAGAAAAAAAAAAAPDSSGLAAMDIDTPADTAQQQQQQSGPAAAAAAAAAAAGVNPNKEDPSQLHGLDTSDLLAVPSRPWIPDSLLQLLTSAAAVAAASLQQQQPQQQQEQRDALLNPAQVLMLTAHAALLECGFVYTPPAAQPAADAAGGCSAAEGGATTAAAAAAAGVAVPSGSPNSSSEHKEGQELQQLLRGPGGIYSVSYSLPAAAAAVSPDAAAGVTGETLPGGIIELRGIDMGQHLVLVGALKHPAAAAGAGASSSSNKAGRVVATLSLLESQITAAGCSPQQSPPQPHSHQLSLEPQQQQQQQQAEVTGYPACAFQDLPRLWVQLKDGLGLPLLLAACAAAGLPPPVGLNSLTYDLQEAILGLLEVSNYARSKGCCCWCTASFLVHHC
jgi:hypothetical protein